MLLDDYESKRINKDTVIIEATSGNTGIALAYFGSKFNNKVIIVMPNSMSKQRRDMIASFGAELVLVQGGMKECNEKALELHKSLQNSIILHKKPPTDFDWRKMRFNIIIRFSLSKITSS